MTVAADPQYFYIRKALNGFGSGHELITVGRFRNPDTVDVVVANQTSITLYSLETESQISTLPVLEPLTTYPVIGNITAISTINLSDQQRIINERQFPFGKSQNSSLIDPKELFGGEVDSISGLDVWKYLKSLEARESEGEINQGRDELEIKYDCDYLVTIGTSGNMTLWGIVEVDKAPPKYSALSSEGVNGKIRFVPVYEVPFTKPTTSYKSLPQHLAIDPYNRAICVANIIDVIKTSRLTKSDVGDFESFTPKNLDCECVIHGVSFLYTDPISENDKLQLVAACTEDVKKQVFVALITFPSIIPNEGSFPEKVERLPLSFAQSEPRSPLKKRIPVPLFIIALREHIGCFVLVTDTSIQFIRASDITNGTPIILDSSTYSIPIPTTYAHHPRQDVFYLGFDNGEIYRYSINSPAHNDIHLGPLKSEDVFKRSLIARLPAGSGVQSISVLSESLVEDLSIPDPEEADESLKSVIRGSETVDILCVVDVKGGISTFLANPFSSYLIQGSHSHSPLLSFCLPTHSSSTAIPSTTQQKTILTLTGSSSGSGSLTQLRRTVNVTVVTSSVGDQSFGGRGDNEGFEGTEMWSFSDSPDAEVDSYLAISFVNETKFMFLGGGELEDVTDRVGLLSEKPSCLVTSLLARNYLVQVHHTGVVVSFFDPLQSTSPNNSPPPSSKSWHWDSKENGYHRIDLACSSYDDFIFFCVTADFDSQSSNSVVAMKIVVDSEGNVQFHVLCRIAMMEQPCRMTSANREISELLHTSHLLFVGTYNSNIVAMSMNADNSNLNMVANISIPRYRSLVDSKPADSIPHSFAILPFDDTVYFLTGLRDGTVVSGVLKQSAQSDDNESIIALTDMKARQIGVKPVTLVPSSRDSTSDAYVLAFSDQNPWKLILEKSQLEFTRVEFDESSTAVSFTFEPEKSGFMIISNNALYFVYLQTSQVGFSEYSLTETPRYVLQLSNTQHFVIAANYRSSDSKNFPCSKLMLFSADLLKSKNSLLPVEIPTVDLKDVEFKENSADNTLLKNAEVVLSVSEFRRNDSTSWVLVGTGIYSNDTSPHMSAGRFFLYQIEELTIPGGNSKRYRLSNQYTHDTLKSGMVTGVLKFGQDGLLVSSGKSLILFTTGHGLTETAKVEARYPIMSLKARENGIIAGHQKESVTYYKYDREDKKLVPLASDRFSRTISDLVFWGEHNLVGVDKYGNIFGLVYVPDSEEFTFHEVFCFHLGEICMRLETGSLVDRPESLDMEQLSMTLSQSQINDMPATTSEQIIAATILGSIYVIQPISESEFNLLNVLQMALLNYPGSHPILNAPHDAFRGMQYPAHHLIDGVIVESFFRLQEAEREWIVQTMASIWMRKWRMGEAGFGNEHAPALATDLIETYDGIGLKEKSDMDNCIEGLSVGMLKAALLGMVRKTV